MRRPGFLGDLSDTWFGNVKSMKRKTNAWAAQEMQTDLSFCSPGWDLVRNNWGQRLCKPPQQPPTCQPGWKQIQCSGTDDSMCCVKEADAAQFAKDSASFTNEQYTILPDSIKQNPAALQFFDKCVAGKPDATINAYGMKDAFQSSRNRVECLTATEHFMQRGDLPIHLKEGEPSVMYANCIQGRGPENKKICQQDAENVYHRGNETHSTAKERWAKGWPVKRGVWPDIPGNTD